jgi:hypothetical protein
MSTPRRAWTAEQVLALGVRCTVPQAGEIIAGLSETQSYELHKRGEFPVPVLKVGRRLVVPVSAVLELLGLVERVEAIGGLIESSRSRGMITPAEAEGLWDRLRGLGGPSTGSPHRSPVSDLGGRRERARLGNSGQT